MITNIAEAVQKVQAEDAELVVPEEHSKVVGGSTAARLIACPGSYQLIKQLGPVDDSSEYAEEGTALHEAMAHWLDLETPIPVTELEGLIFNGYEMEPRLVHEFLVPAARAFEDYYDKSRSEGDMEYMVECKVSIILPSDLLEMLNDAVFGRADIIGRTSRRTTIWDWKFGQVPVKALNNDQGMFYAAAALDTFPDMFGMSDNWPIEIVICQPAVYDDNEPRPYDRWSTTLGEVKAFKEDLFDAIRLALDEDPPKARGDHCRFAPCKSICPLHTAPLSALATVKDEIDKIEPTLIDAPEDGQIEIQDGLAEMYGRAMDLCEVLEPWMREIRAQVHSRLEAGLPVHGYKLVPKRAQRKWLNEEAAIKLMRRLKLHKQDQFDLKLISPAEAERRLKAKKIVLTERQKSDFAAVCPAVSGGTTLAPWDDNRPPIEATSKKLRELAEKLKPE